MSSERPPRPPAFPDDQTVGGARLGAAPRIATAEGGAGSWRTAHTLGWLSVAILCALFLIGGILIGRRHHPAVAPVVPAAGVLVAAPNPVPGGAGEGTTVVAWVTPDGMVGQVWLATDGQGETLFAQGASGAQYAPFILTGHTYVFRLYAGTGHVGMAAQTVTVTHPA